MREELRQVLLDVLEVPSIAESDSVETIAAWDSVRHLSLVMALEERFDIMFDAEEIPALTSVGAIEQALARHRDAAAA